MCSLSFSKNIVVTSLASEQLQLIFTIMHCIRTALRPSSHIDTFVISLKPIFREVPWLTGRNFESSSKDRPI